MLALFKHSIKQTQKAFNARNLLTLTPSAELQDEHMALFSLHHGHMPAQATDLLEHLQHMRQGLMQNPASSASMPKQNCKGSCSSSSDAGSSQSNSQVTAGRNGVKGSASDCISSPDEDEASDESKARSEHGTEATADLQSQATETQEALFQNLDAILSTNARPGMLRRRVEQASPSATCARTSCLHTQVLRVPVKHVNVGYTGTASCGLLVILPMHNKSVDVCATEYGTVACHVPHMLKDCYLCRC